MEAPPDHYLGPAASRGHGFFAGRRVTAVTGEAAATF